MVHGKSFELKVGRLGFQPQFCYGWPRIMSGSSFFFPFKAYTGTTWLPRALLVLAFIKWLPSEHSLQSSPDEVDPSGHSHLPGPCMSTRPGEKQASSLPCAHHKILIREFKILKWFRSPKSGRNVLCPAALWAIYLLSASSKKLTESIQTCLKTGLTHFLPTPPPTPGLPWRSALKLRPGHPLARYRTDKSLRCCLCSLPPLADTGLSANASGRLTNLELPSSSFPFLGLK